MRSYDPSILQDAEPGRLPNPETMLAPAGTCYKQRKELASGEIVPYGITAVQGDSALLAREANSTVGKVLVCIIDTGIAANHTDLRNNSISGCGDPTESSGCPADWRRDTVGHGRVFLLSSHY
jgi:hypothetical protein